MPSSKELLEMAHTEWKNREERRKLHDEVSWESGWISCYLSRPHTPAPMIDSLDDERLPFSISDEDLIDFNVWMKEHDRTATLAAEQTDNVLTVLKKRYKNEMAILDYVEMIECEVMALRQSTTAAQEDMR